MIEYYKLSLLRNAEHGEVLILDKIYLEINGEESRVMEYKSRQGKLLNSKLEKISKDEAIESLR